MCYMCDYKCKTIISHNKLRSFPRSFNVNRFVKLSLSLNLYWTLRDRNRADSIITLPQYHPPTHRKLFKHLKVTYTQVWYIIGSVSSSPTHLHSEKLGLIRVTYDPPVSIRVNKHLMWLILMCDMSLEPSAQVLLISTQKK